MVMMKAVVLAVALAMASAGRADFPVDRLLDDPAAARTFDYWRLRDGQGPETIAPLRKIADASMTTKNGPFAGRCLTDAEVEIKAGLKGAEIAASSSELRDNRDAAAGAIRRINHALSLLMAGGSSGDPALDEPIQPFLVRARTDKTARARELARRVAVDQAIRRGFENTILSGPVPPSARAVMEAPLVNRVCRIDADNVAWIKREVRAHGWFEISRYGREADEDAWLLAQHADDDVAFQAEILALLGELLKKGETDPKSYAYLYDRIATNTGKPQRYGTQGGCRDGKRFTAPLEDPTRVDQLRAEVGMPTLAEYNARFTCHS